MVIRRELIVLFVLTFVMSCHKSSDNAQTATGDSLVKTIENVGNVGVLIPTDLANLGNALIVEKGTSLTTNTVASTLGIEAPVSKAGAPVRIDASVAVSAGDIGRLKIDLPFEAGLWATETLVVIYAVKNEEGKIVVGYILEGGASGFSVVGNNLRFALRGFGSYQAARVAAVITEEKTVVTKATSIEAASKLNLEPFLTVANFPKTNTRIALENQFSVGEYSFLTKYPDDPPSAYDTCIDAALNSIKANVLGKRVSFYGTIDTTECKKLDEALTLKSSLTVYLSTEDLSWDASQYKDKGYADFTKSPDFVTSSIFLNKAHDMYFAIEVAQEFTDGNSFSYKLLRSRTDGAPCSIGQTSSGFKVLDDCVEYWTSEDKTNGNVINQFSKISYKDIGWEVSDQAYAWFSSGVSQCTFDNWTGTVTFAGAQNSPTYEFTNGTVTKKGSLQFPMNLVNPMRVRKYH